MMDEENKNRSDQTPALSRRDFLKRAGITVGTLTFIGVAGANVQRADAARQDAVLLRAMTIGNPGACRNV
jgi:hypothetical protein